MSTRLRDLKTLLQHNLLKKIFENQLLLAPVKFTPGDRVLDIGTGSGLWALDMTETVGPAVHICGVDIESRLFPASPPKNMAFQVKSLTSLPTDWSDAFTLSQALGEIYWVLRPRGWVQLAEEIPWIERGSPDRPCTVKVMSLIRCLAKSRNLYLDCVSHMLETADFVDVKTEGRIVRMGKWGGEDGITTAVNHAAMFRGTKTPVLQAGGYGIVATESEYDVHWDGIPGTKVEYITFWARKPEN
ncbi:hypothetical protein K438DRAFT_1910872 [Mycena galopus ATCC 62051]|nr:hypothetical protein K438DRAFT_1910872 [Mycena galopus ATCC 62051]